jgi:phenylpropionate dioxygenase-like ring-hydroxylating dioxygenase large terminal subunit
VYPFKSDASYPRNRWYVAAYGSEISRIPLERTVLDTPLVFYRTELSQIVAMYGLCPHRYYPLALGRLDGDAIVCGYHGFTFGADGKCLRVPAQGGGTGFHQPTYKVIERGPWVWIWMGEAASAQVGLLPPHDDFGLGVPGWAHCAPNHFLLKARSQLLIDNLMDLTHVAFVHGSLIDADVLVTSKIQQLQRERSFRVSRLSDMAWSSFHDFLFGAANRFDGMSSVDAVTDFYGPELIRTSGPITKRIDNREVVPAALGELYFLHAVTPATAKTTHYFGLITRNYRFDEPSFDEALQGLDRSVRQQDVDALEHVELRLDEAAARQHELLVRSDSAAVKVRSLIQEMIDRE